MSSCLGLYIENNLIKYAKVTKERELVKVESFGVKFYDKIGEAISQIVSETFSYKTPISINLSEETYQYFYFFNLLNRNDLKKAIETEFDSYCYDKGYNRNALETRYALVPDVQNSEKIKAIYISTNKIEVNRKMQELEGNSVSNIFPLPMCISNIIDATKNENAIIVNIEEKTTLTTIVNQSIYSVDKLEEGIAVILDNINEKENSYSKSYEICKNTTIYTMEGKELLQQQEEENLYLEDIMPTLYAIVQKLKDFVDSSINRIDKIYLTGTGCMINNIDLYFQEYFPSTKCEILRPYFISDNIKINIKDYIEVNSAIALGMQGLGLGVKNLNFKKPSFSDQLPDWMKVEIGSKKEKSGRKGKKSGNFSFDLNAKWDSMEKWLLRTTMGLIAFIIIYSVITTFLRVQTNNKLLSVEEVRQDTNNQINLASNDTQTLNNKASDYEKMTENLKNYSNQVSENLRTKNVIPLLLTRIMNVNPEGVTITSIENTVDSHIVINAQSEDYDLLGFLKGSLIVEGILSPSTVISTSGIKQNGIVKIVIEGDLP